MSCKTGSCWKNDYTQFTRLLAEIRASGLSENQYADLKVSMDLDRTDIDKVLERAEVEWEKMKSNLK
jgi:hypothetical protein